MALYRHVSDRSDLLAAMLDTALGEPPDLCGPWRQRFRTLWDALAATYATNPWMLQLPADINALTPRNLEWIDIALSVLDASTLPPSSRLSTVLLTIETVRFDSRRRQAAGAQGSDLDRLLADLTRASAHLPADRFPQLRTLAGGSQPPPQDHVREVMLGALAPYFPEGERR